MTVRLVWMLYCRVAWSGMAEWSSCPSSIASPVLMSWAARTTVAGFMWLPAPRSSPAPYFDGQRWASVGGRHVCAESGAVVSASVTMTAIPVRTMRMCGLLSRPRVAAASIDALGTMLYHLYRGRAWYPSPSRFLTAVLEGGKRLLGTATQGGDFDASVWRDETPPCGHVWPGVGPGRFDRLASLTTRRR